MLKDMCCEATLCSHVLRGSATLRCAAKQGYIEMYYEILCEARLC